MNTLPRYDINRARNLGDAPFGGESCSSGMHYYVHVAIERKEAILDPQGKAAHHALDSLGLKDITDARIGKFVRLDVEADSPEQANAAAREASEKLLANPIMETYRIIETKAV